MRKKKLIIEIEHKLPRMRIPKPGSVHKDIKKEENKKRCRKKVDYDE